jgi:WD40 repeat protein
LKIFVQLEKIKKGAISYISASNQSRYDNQDKSLELAIVSKNGGVYLMQDIQELTKTPQIVAITQQQACSVFAMEVHPSKPLLAIGGSDGNLHIWNYETREKVGEKLLEGCFFKCVKYSPNGLVLGAGFENGTLSFFDSESLQVICSHFYFQTNH